MPNKPPIRLHNKPALTERRRKLRRRLPPAEAALWNVLKNAKLDGRKFRRQHNVGPFILDFYCVEESLAIELDGQVHRNENAEINDLKRTGYLRKARIRVLRFENFLVFDE